MKKILITGFEPFGKFKKNPTMDLVHHFANKKIGKHNICSVVLPVTYTDSFKKLNSVVRKTKPDLVILTGLAADRENICLERVAINWLESSIKDNRGQRATGKKILSKGPDGILTKIDISKIIRKLGKKNSVVVSNTAGTYVCNFLYYRALNHPQLKNKTLFVHIPKIKGINPGGQLTLKILQQSIESLIKLF